MTEEEWEHVVEPEGLIEHLWASLTERKTKLFEAACCRRLWGILVDERSLRAVQTVELFADGQAPEDDLLAAGVDAAAVFREQQEAAEANSVDWSREPNVLASSAVWSSTSNASELLHHGYTLAELANGVTNRLAAAAESLSAEMEVQTRLFRDIFGNPFRPVAVDPEWLTSDVVALARGIYEERAFDRMPILADALQDAGCDNDDVLTHCRDTSATHVRGCWVVDLILGKG